MPLWADLAAAGCIHSALLQGQTCGFAPAAQLLLADGGAQLGSGSGFLVS